MFLENNLIDFYDILYSHSVPSTKSWLTSIFDISEWLGVATFKNYFMPFSVSGMFFTKFQLIFLKASTFLRLIIYYR